MFDLKPDIGEQKMKFEDKFIGFVDLLGFKNLVEAAEKGTGIELPELVDLLKLLGTPGKVERIKKTGPTTCPESSYINRDLSFQLTQISDCVIVSSEISPAGVINLISHCWGAVIELMAKGIMCRGYITRGSLFHSDSDFIGTGFHYAYSKESGVSAFKQEADERGTPFVEIDSVVCEYIKNCGDSCVQKMFSRMVKEDGNVVALFPFKLLSHSFIVAGFGQSFDPEEEKTSNDNLRKMLHNFKSKVMSYVDESNPRAVEKARHYIRALDAQLEMCDHIDDMIEKLSAPINI